MQQQEEMFRTHQMSKSKNLQRPPKAVSLGHRPTHALGRLPPPPHPPTNPAASHLHLVSASSDDLLGQYYVYGDGDDKSGDDKSGDDGGYGGYGYGDKGGDDGGYGYKGGYAYGYDYGKGGVPAPTPSFTGVWTNLPSTTHHPPRPSCDDWAGYSCSALENWGCDCAGCDWCVAKLH